MLQDMLFFTRRGAVGLVGPSLRTVAIHGETDSVRCCGYSWSDAVMSLLILVDGFSSERCASTVDNMSWKRNPGLRATRLGARGRLAFPS